MLDYSANYEQAYRLNRVCLQQPMEPYSHGYKSYSSFQFRKHSEMCTYEHEMAFHTINWHDIDMYYSKYKASFGLSKPTYFNKFRFS